MKKVLFRIMTGLFSFLFVLLVLVYIGVKFLGTEEGSRWVLTKAQKVLAQKFATELQFSEAQIRLFSGIHFKDLKIDSKLNGNRIQIQISRFDIDYIIEYFSRKVLIERLSIERPSFQVQLNIDASPKAKPQEFSSKENVPLVVLLAKFLESPLVSVTMRRFELSEFDLDLHLKAGENSLTAVIKNLNIRASGQLSENHLSLESEVKANHANHVEISGRDRHLALDWDLNTKGNIKIEKNGQNWSYSIPENFVNFELQNLIVQMSELETQTQLQLPWVKIKSETNLLAETEHAFEFDSGSLKSAHDNSQIQTSPFSLIKRSLDQAMSLKFGSYEAAITAELKKDVELNVKSILHQLDFPSQLNMPIDLKLGAQANISLDLKHFAAHFAAGLSEIDLSLGQFTIGRNQAKDPWELMGNVQIFLDPKLAKKMKSGAELSKMGRIEINSKLSGKLSNEQRLHLDTQTDIAKIILPVSKKSFAIHISSANDFQKSSAPDGRDLGVGVNSTSELKLSNPEIGEWKVNSNSEVHLDNLNKKEIIGKIELSELSAGDSDLLPAKLVQPVVMSHHLSMNQEDLSFELKGLAPAIEITKLGILGDTKFNVNLKGDHLSTEKNFKIQVEMDQGPLKLNVVNASLAAIPIASMKMNLAATLKQQTLFNLEKLQFNLNQDLVRVTADGTGNLKTKDVQIQINNQMNFPRSLPELFGQKVTGEVLVPMNFSVRHGKDINIDGTVELKKMGVQHDDISLSGLSGRIPFSEHLILEKDHIRFTELVTQNAFERVNFERLRPLLQSSELITIDKIHWQEKVYGPLVGFFSIRQNMFILHEFSLDLGSGSIYGEVAFDAYPKNLQLGLLSRVTGLDLAQVLPRKFLKKIPEGDKTISARTGFVFSLNRAILNGRIDVTQIGSAQMITLINLLDPQFQDDKMNKMRTLLEVGYPTAVAMNFNQGFLDLDLDLTALGINQHQALRSIPLSGFLLKPTAEIVSASQKGPLK